MQPIRTRLALALAALLLLPLVASCSGSSSDSLGSSEGDVAASLPEEAARESEVRDDGGVALSEGGGDAMADTAAVAQDEAVDLESPAVIATGTVSLESEDVARARFDVRRIVDEHRGTVAEQETTTGDEGEVSSARLVVRVPSARFSDVTAALEEVGTLTASTSSSDDVSTEVVDIEARVRAQRKSVARIETLLARAESIQQIVAVESQLSSRQAELDALLARQAWLADQTSLSTITVYVEQAGEEDDEPDEDRTGFLAGLADGWDSFVGGLGAALTVIGFLLPWALAAALVGGLVLTLVRRRRRGAPAASVPTAP